GLSGDDAATMFQDREGTIWVATAEGLDRFRDFAVATIPRLPLPVTALADHDGSLWISTGDGLDHLDRGTVTAYRTHRSTGLDGSPYVKEIIGTGLPNGGVQSLYKDGRGRLWVALYSGLGYLEDDRFRYVKGFPSEGQSYAFSSDARGDLWIAHDPGGLI